MVLRSGNGGDIRIFEQGIAVGFKFRTVVDVGEYHSILIKAQVILALKLRIVGKGKTADNGNKRNGKL